MHAAATSGKEVQETRSAREAAWPQAVTPSRLTGAGPSLGPHAGLVTIELKSPAPARNVGAGLAPEIFM